MTQPAPPERYSFSNEAISRALESAKRTREGINLEKIAKISPSHSPLTLLAECISITTRDHQVCLELPLGLGSACLPIPINIPDDTAAQACLDICTILGVPTGVCVRVVVGGVTVVRQCFGFGC
jgi:hypothetical protein